MDVPRDTKVPVYLSADLKAQIEDRAESRDQSMSAYLKELARRDIQKAIVEKELHE